MGGAAPVAPVSGLGITRSGILNVIISRSRYAKSVYGGGSMEPAAEGIHKRCSRRENAKDAFFEGMS